TPDASDQCYIYELMVFAPPPTVGAVATVRVTARVRNASRTVEQILMPGPILAFTSGLASGAGAGWNGNSLSVHWGEIKIQGTTAIISNPIQANPARTVDALIDAGGYLGANDEDRWLRVFANGLYSGPPYDEGTYADIPTLQDEQNTNPYDFSTAHNNLFHNQSVTIDVWNYAIAKRTAQRYGTYYTTDNLGRLYLDGKGSPLQFNAITNGRSCGIMFVDTIDQLPPKADGSNLAPISFSGLYHTSGIFYIAANFSTAGLGLGGTTNVLAPPILQSRGSISENTNTLTLSGGETTNAMKVGDILLIGKGAGGWDVEEFRITNVVDAQTLTVVASTSRVQVPPGPPPGPSPAYADHVNQNFIITTTIDESTRTLVTGLQYNFFGAVYCAGQVNMSGQPKVFGTVTAERGYAAGGNPEVWYDWNFSKGDLTQYGVPTVVKGAWREIY
ncbi:MAG: hypothetical protein OEZ30_09265, partial [Candidatus Aminicenantes bacterium]|nr:hypothetical protein [Candidatus Aminicenantes bacterium]